MKAKKNKKWILSGGITICLIFTIVILLKNCFNDTERAELFTLVKEGLHNYYSKHGCYPDKLTDLAISDYPAGTSPSNLDDFKYRAKCNWFICENKIWNRIYILRGQKEDIIGKGFDDYKTAQEWSEREFKRLLRNFGDGLN